MQAARSAMRRLPRGVRAVLCLSVWSALAGAARAGDSPADVDAKQWLARVHEATSHRNFQGTFVVMAGNAVASSRIVHYCQGANQYERIESLDGEQRQVYRHNELVHSYWPHERFAVIETRQAMSQFPALLSADADRILQFYDVKPLGQARVAGHAATGLLLRPKDQYRFGYRLWSDESTGLLLRAEVFDAHDVVIEASAFSDLMIGVKAQPELVLQAMKRVEGYRVDRPTMTPVDLDREGWRFAQLPDGFRQVHSVRRSVSTMGPHPASLLEPTALQQPAAPTVLQAIYSDGLTYVSVFIEDYDAGRHHREGVMALGATQTLLKRQGDWWITVIGDVPVVTLRAFATGIGRR